MQVRLLCSLIILICYAQVALAQNFDDPVSPTSSISFPPDQHTVTSSITITASACDDVGVAKVEFYYDSTFIGSDIMQPYSILWDPTGISNGTHTLSARAYDAAGNIGISASINITLSVSGTDTTLPTTSITSPNSGATVSGSVTINASASDNVGVTKVEFYRGTTLIGDDTSSPYSVTWDTSGLSGSYSLTSKAYDAANNIGTSSAVNVTVDNTAPTSSITSPSGGGTVSGNVTINATASDNIGVTKVEFYRGTTLIGDDTSSPYSVTWDTSGLSGSYSLTSKAYDAANNIGTSSAVNVTVDNTVPTTSITSPSGGATVSGNVTINATASDNIGVTKVEFYRGTTLIGDDASSPYSVTWNTSGLSGSYSLTSKAYDAANNIGTSSAVNVMVDNTVPTTSITSPSGGATVSGNVPINATASDNVAVTKVEFYRGTTLIDTDTSSPYSVTWNTSGLSGSHSLTSKAYDAANNTGTSSAINVTVSNDTTPPTTSITSPQNNAIVMGTTVSLVASASDNVGVTNVEFLVDGNVVGSDSTSTYGFTWDSTTVSTGNHTLESKAYDAAGNHATSAGITVFRVLFFDDFEDGSASDWTFSGGGSWSVISGSLRGNANNAQAMAPFSGCTTCTIEGDLELSQAGEFKVVSLLGWYQSSATKVELTMNDFDNKWQLKQRVSGSTVASQNYTQTLSANVNYHVKLQYDGTNFKVYVDGVLIITMPKASGTSPSGNVGYGVDGIGVFREIKVY